MVEDTIQWSLVPSVVKPDILQSVETLSIQSGEGREQVLGAVVADILVHRRGDADDQRPVAEARRPVRPPQPQVVTVDLEQRAITAVPHDAFHATLWTLLEPGLQLLDVHWWRVPDADTAV